MGAIYLVRHGQAAFGTDDYDRLRNGAGHSGRRSRDRRRLCGREHSRSRRVQTRSVDRVLDGRLLRAVAERELARIGACARAFPSFTRALHAWTEGPIAAIVAAALESPPQIAVELNLRIRNSAVTEFTMSARRHQLLSFNALPHLEAQSDATLMTYA